MTSPIYVINLERSAQRKIDFVKNNPNLSYEFVTGVDGRLLSEEQIHDEKHFIHPLHFPSKGAYGVALSHLDLWNKSIFENKILTIAEDDAIFRTDFESYSSKLIASIKGKWDIILWGWNFDSILSVSVLPGVSPCIIRFSQEGLRKNIEKYRVGLNESNLLRLHQCFGIPAYTITPDGAKKFKDKCFPMENFELYFLGLNRSLPNTGIDISMNKIYRETFSLVAFPPLAVTKNEHEISTIQKKDE